MTHWNLNGQITNGYSDEKHSINYHKISKLTVLHYSMKSLILNLKVQRAQTTFFGFPDFFTLR